MERGISGGLLLAAIFVVTLGGLRMASVVHFEVDDGTKFLLGLAALLGLIALFQGRITKLTMPGGMSIDLATIKQGVDAAVANTKRLSDRQDELAAPKMSARTFDAREAVPSVAVPTDSQDLNKGRFGGASESNGRVLEADVGESSIHPGWFRIDLRVEPKLQPLDHPVTFYLHESFDPADQVQVVNPTSGVARLTVLAWGAFTVGALTDGGNTRLELDLSQDPRFPALFRKR
jgi:hypothetical protein